MRRIGFTLLEVLAVIVLVSLVLGLALDFYVDISRATLRATETGRGVRRAAAIVDRVAADLEGVYLMRRPEGVDPLAHPWLFLAESRYAREGADHLRFITRNHEPRRTAAAEADYALVTYIAVPTGEGTFSLHRWSKPRIPDGPERVWPSNTDPDAVLIADDLEAFGVVLIDDQGEPHDRWDSGGLVDSGTLPMAAEILVAMAESDDPRLASVDASDQEVEPYRRRVLLPIRPLDWAELLASAEGEDDEDTECDRELFWDLTVEECVEWDLAFRGCPSECSCSSNRNCGQCTRPELVEEVRPLCPVKNRPWAAYPDQISDGFSFLEKEKCRC